MIGSRGIGILVIAVVLGLAIAPLASAGIVDSGASAAESVVDDTSTSVEPDAADEGETNDSPNGSEVSTFVQSSSADAETSVESELFDATFESADEEARADVVTDRIDRLEERYAALEAERDELEAEGEELNDTVYDARMTRFTVQLAALESAIQTTEQRAEETPGVDSDGVAELRANASELAGEEVAAIATDLAGIDPPGHGGENAPGNGPPADDVGGGPHDDPSGSSDDSTAE